MNSLLKIRTLGVLDLVLSGIILTAGFNLIVHNWQKNQNIACLFVLFLNMSYHDGALSFGKYAVTVIHLVGTVLLVLPMAFSLHGSDIRLL